MIKFPNSTKRSLLPHRILVSILAIAAAAAATRASTESMDTRAGVEAPPVARPDPNRKSLAGSGRWHSSRAAVIADRDWQVHVSREKDGSIRGKLHLLGSPAVSHATVRGHLGEGEVFGELLDDAGSRIGTFSGAVSAGGITGSYAMNDGDRGAWSWEGPPPD